MNVEIDKNKIKIGLYVVSTPIGNLKDITIRALDILKSSEFIICEDTRVSSKLLNAYKIKKKLIYNHKFNEKKNINKIIEILKSNKLVSIISDAGTPAISDPGRILIKECIKNNIEIFPIPGPSAVSAAISISGFSDQFYFHGFLPDKETAISRDFDFLSKINSSIVFFISSKKINKIIPFIKKNFKGRKILICREMTKFYEEFVRSEVEELELFNNNLKGELTIVISEKKYDKKTSHILSESDKRIIKKMINKLSIKEISNLIHQNNKISKKIIYDYCLKIKNEN